MTNCLFVADLHGAIKKYATLFGRIREERPDLVFLGGDLLPGGAILGADPFSGDFVEDFLIPGFKALRRDMGSNYPQVFTILGNDDPRCEEGDFLCGETLGLWTYLHLRHAAHGNYRMAGCAFVPPTPFMLKDWERFDVSRFVDVGCSAPEEGHLTYPVDPEELRYATIDDHLKTLETGENGIVLFHAPPYDTGLDRAALDGKFIDGAPMDVHVGSIAVRRFIEAKQPLVTLHGHVHESFRLTGVWKQQLGNTWCLSAAGEGQDLTLVRFTLENPGGVERESLPHPFPSCGLSS
jgi:uncharacterized protein